MRIVLALATASLAGGAPVEPQARPPAPAPTALTAPAASAAPTASAALTASAAPGAAAFDAYLGQVRAKALAAGVSAATLERELAGLTPNERVIGYDRAQPDDSARVRPVFRDYLAGRVDEARIARGRALTAELGPVLAQIEAKYGVPGPMIVAIWGVETSYGGYTGSFDLVRSLATLAWEGRRRALFEGELIAALKLLDRGVVARPALVGSWAGATGQPQFLPSSYARYAVDGDGDGRADIWGSRADTLASIANYLRDNGWTKGLPWGTPVYVPPTVERWRLRSITPSRSCARPLAAHSRWLSIGEWRAMGLAPLGMRWPAAETMATLIEPDGEGQGAYLTYGNYRALLAYNCANFYALSAGLLAGRIAERPAGAAAGGGAGGVR